MSDVVSNLVDHLLTQQKIHTEELKKIRGALEAIQNICNHNWVDDGRDSHYTHGICTKCKLKDYKWK